jgi:hypothetical protein
MFVFHIFMHPIIYLKLTDVLKQSLIFNYRITSPDYTKKLATHKTFLSKSRILPDKTLLLLPNNYGNLQ